MSLILFNTEENIGELENFKLLPNELQDSIVINIITNSKREIRMYNVCAFIYSIMRKHYVRTQKY